MGEASPFGDQWADVVDELSFGVIVQCLSTLCQNLPVPTLLNLVPLIFNEAIDLSASPAGLSSKTLFPLEQQLTLHLE
jgi:hypothetical protein